MNAHDLKIERRRFLQVVNTSLFLSPSVFATAPKPRELAFLHTHTGERLIVTYADEAGYLTSGLVGINRLLRGFRTGELHPIDTGVLNILYAARESLSADGVFEVISGYRSPKTNEMLRQRGHGLELGSRFKRVTHSPQHYLCVSR